jgi:uncharacterized protein (TIGR03437 family)
MRLFFVQLLLVASAWAQPLIYNRSVVNAASFMPQGIPGGAIARGSIFSIFGTRFGPSSAAQASAFPLQPTLSGVSITVTQGNTTVNAIPLYVSGTQVNAIMPSNAPIGLASMRLVSGSSRSNPVPVRIADSGLGIFAARQTGAGPGILFNYIAADNQPLNAPTVTAQPGQVITLYGTGLGPAPGGVDNLAPPAVTLPTKVEVFVGGKTAAVQYSGRTPCCSGVDQVVFQIPNDAPMGCWVPVYVRTAGTTVSNVVTMAIQNAGTACYQDPLATTLVAGGKTGAFVAVRATTRQDVGTTAPIDVSADYHASFAAQVIATPFPFTPLASLPPAGTCTEYTLGGDMLGGDALPGYAPMGRVLDFGALFNLSGPRGTRMLTELFAKSRVGYLGGSITGNLIPNTLFLDPGAYTVMGLGGVDIGAFSATMNVPQPLTWTNRDQLTGVSRSQPLTISWSGGDASQFVGVVGFGEDLPTNSSAAFVCLASRGASSFTIPPVILSNVPATRPNPLQSKSAIYLVSVPGSSITNLNAGGLDNGSALFTYVNGKTVVFQ